MSRLGSALVLLLFSQTAVALDLAQAPFAQESWPVAGAVYAVHQTPDGFLWLGTQSGLRRFDGVAFVGPTATSVDELGDGHCRILLTSKDGSLWIATGGGFSNPEVTGLHLKSGRPGLVRMKAGAFRRFTVADGLSDDWVRALAEDENGLWIGTEKGLSLLQGAAVRTFGEGAGLGAEMITSLHVDRAGVLWVGTRKGLFVRRQTGAGFRFQRTDLDMTIQHVDSDRQGRLWVATADALIRRKPGLPDISVRAERPPSVVMVDANDQVWLGTEDALFSVKESLEENTANPETRKEGQGPSGSGEAAPSSGLVLSATGVRGRVVDLHEDREGSLWVGLRTGGLVQLKEARLRNIGQPEGLGGGMAFTLAAAPDGSVWITHTQGVSRWADGHLTNFMAGQDLPDDFWRTVAVGRDGTVWVGSRSAGIARFRDGRFSTLGLADGLRALEIHTLFVDSRGDLWVSYGQVPGKSPGGVTRYLGGTPAGKATHFDAGVGLCPGRHGLFKEAPDGQTMWIAGSGGLSRLPLGPGRPDAERARCYDTKDGLPGRSISAMHVESHDTVWVATLEETTILRLRGERFQAIPPDVLPAAMTFSMTDNGLGQLWLTSSVGVHRIALADMHGFLDGTQKTIPVLSYGADDGMRSQECAAYYQPCAARDLEGRLWAPTLAGLTVFSEPEEAPRPTTSVMLDDVSIGGKSVSTRGSLTLAAGGGDVAFRFTAPTFLAAHRLKFHHRLDGLDDAWVAVKGDRSVHYGHLGPGRYVFRVRGTDELDRPLGEEIRLPILVPPYFYQTWFFFVGVAALLVLAGFAVHRLRVRQIEGRFAAVQAERARIARDLHDELAQGFAAMGLHIDGLKMMLKTAPENVIEMLDQTRGVVTVCQAETRRAIWNIRQPGLKNLSLRQVLEKTIASAPRSPGVKVELTVTGPPLDLSAMMEHEVQHIVREAIVNALRHAAATHIGVNATLDEKGLHIQVKDNGKGMPAGGPPTPESGSGGMGLVGMRERASRITGTLTINGNEGAEGAGTDVSLRIARDVLHV